MWLAFCRHESVFARSLSSDQRLFPQTLLAAAGKKLLAADPEALLYAAKAGNVTKVWRVLASCPSTPDHRPITREARAPDARSPSPCTHHHPHPTPLSALAWSIDLLTMLPRLQINQIVAAGGNLEVKDKWVRTYTHPAREVRTPKRKPLHSELLGQHELIYGRCGDHSVV